MPAAQRLRQADQKTALIFATGMAQYSVDSYEAGAQDYLVKAVQYADFARKMAHVLARCRRENETLLVTQQSGVQRLLLRDILYLEVQDSTLLLTNGENLQIGCPRKRAFMQELTEAMGNEIIL